MSFDGRHRPPLPLFSPAPVGAALHFEGPALRIGAAAKRLGGVAAFSAYLDTPISRREFLVGGQFRVRSVCTAGAKQVQTCANLCMPECTRSCLVR